MNAAQYRLLFVGGKKRNIPEGKILCQYDQYDQDSREMAKGELPIGRTGYHMVLCFKDFASHEACEAFKAKSKIAGIPYVQASGGLGALIEQAKEQGYDLSPVINGMQKKKEPEEVDVSVGSFPASAKAAVLADGLQVWVMPNRNKGMSVLIREDLLDEAIKIVKKKKLGKGVRGGLTPKEGAVVAEELDRKFKYSERGYSLNQKGAFRAINIGLGTSKAYTPASKKKVKKRKKVTQVEKKSRRPAVKEGIDAKLDLRTGRIHGKPVEVFLGDISGTLREMLKQSAKRDLLYDKIIELQSENTFYLEKITSIEADKERLQKEVRDLKDLISKS